MKDCPVCLKKFESNEEAEAHLVVYHADVIDKIQRILSSVIPGWQVMVAATSFARRFLGKYEK